jgi:hypothetical protein
MTSGKPIDMSKIRNVIKLYTLGKGMIFISEYLYLSPNTLKKYINQLYGRQTQLVNYIKADGK